MANGFMEDVDPRAPSPGETEDASKLLAMMKAMRDVRTLDDWKAESPERSVVLDGDGWFWCRLGDWPRHGVRSVRGFDGATPDEARAKAAAWVREQAKGV